MAASYDFIQLDVFTRVPLAGNPLAVFTDARGLTDKQMQALSREMNLSETTFILPGEQEPEATEGERVRIFTTREESPFAGHPAIGTALSIYSTAETAPGEIISGAGGLCSPKSRRFPGSDQLNRPASGQTH